MKHLQTFAHSVLLFLMVCCVKAQETVYVATDLGLNFASDAEVSTQAPDGSTVSGTTEFDPGLRFGLAVGSRFGAWLAIELESGFLYNPISRSESWIGNLPLLGNIVLRYDNESGWTPYIGAGAGGSLILVNVQEGDIEEDDSDIAIAWQGLAGVRYRVSERFSVGLGYKYLRTSDTEFSIRNGTVDLEGMENHSIGLTVTWDF
jgi:OmpA-OmpF porin, OOP family